MIGLSGNKGFALPISMMSGTQQWLGANIRHLDLSNCSLTGAYLENPEGSDVPCCIHDSLSRSMLKHPVGDPPLYLSATTTFAFFLLPSNR